MPPWAAEAQPAHHGLPHGCRAISLLPLPPALTLVSAELSLLSPATKMPLRSLFLFVLKRVIAETLSPSPMGSALASGRSVLEPAGTGCVGHGGSFRQLLTGATPAAPQLLKPCHANPRWYLFNILFCRQLCYFEIYITNISIQL